MHVNSEAAVLNANEKGSSSTIETWSNSRGHGRGFSWGKGRSREWDRSSEYISNVQCFNCKRFCHIKAECWAKDKHPKKGVTHVAKEREANNNFMTSSDPRTEANFVLLVDSGCSSHMSEGRKLFSKLNESQKVNNWLTRMRQRWKELALLQ